MIAADSRYAVSTQVTVSCEVCSSCCTVVSTGTTSDCSSANAPIPAASTANVTGGRDRAIPIANEGPPSKRSHHSGTGRA